MPAENSLPSLGRRYNSAIVYFKWKAVYALLSEWSRRIPLTPYLSANIYAKLKPIAQLKSLLEPQPGGESEQVLDLMAVSTWMRCSKQAWIFASRC